MLIIGNWFSLVLLVGAVVSGVWTMQRHHAYFSDFRVCDIWRGRLDGWLYVANSASTTLCLIELVLRSQYLLTADPFTEKWNWLWMGFHSCSALA